MRERSSREAGSLPSPLSANIDFRPYSPPTPSDLSPGLSLVPYNGSGFHAGSSQCYQPVSRTDHPLLMNRLTRNLTRGMFTRRYCCQVTSPMRKMLKNVVQKPSVIGQFDIYLEISALAGVIPGRNLLHSFCLTLFRTIKGSGRFLVLSALPGCSCPRCSLTVDARFSYFSLPRWYSGREPAMK